MPSVALSETWTDNVALAPAELAREDFVTQITPGITFRGIGARASVNGSISVPVLLYARTGAENDNFYPLVDILGKVEAIETILLCRGRRLGHAAVFDSVRRAAR